MAVFCPGAVIVPLQGMQDDLCPIAYPNCTLIDFIDMERIIADRETTSPGCLLDSTLLARERDPGEHWSRGSLIVRAANMTGENLMNYR